MVGNCLQTWKISLFSNRATLFNLLSVSYNISFISVNRRKSGTKLHCIEHNKANSARGLETIYSSGNISLFSNGATLFKFLSVSDNIRNISLNRRKIGTKLFCIVLNKATSARRLESIYSLGNISLFFSRATLNDPLSISDNIRYILLNRRKIGTKLFCIVLCLLKPLQQDDWKLFTALRISRCSPIELLY